MSKIKPVNGRLERIGKLKNDYLYINYAHTPEALELCLRNVKKQFANKNISIVLGCGGNRDYSKVNYRKDNQRYCERIYSPMIILNAEILKK